jgi:hypothetical protein
MMSSRLHKPTRCPLCKGAVIERTSSGAHAGFLWFHCLFCNHWWKFRTDEEVATNQDADVTGEIFIVTKAGITYTLDSIAVTAIPEDVARKHLENRARQQEIESHKLQHDIDDLTATLKIAKAEEDRLWKILQLDESNSQKAAAWRVAYNESKKIAKQIEEPQAQQKRVRSGAFFFEELPSAISAARTDGHGRFSLLIPRKGQYVVAACGPSETFRDIEPYWFVSVSLDGEPQKHLILSNDNVLDARSEDTAQSGRAS